MILIDYKITKFLNEGWLWARAWFPEIVLRKVCVCMHVCMHMYVCMYAYVCMYICLSFHTHMSKPFT